MKKAILSFVKKVIPKRILSKYLQHKFQLKKLDKESIEAEISKLIYSGVSDATADNNVVVSLTSFPARMDEIHHTIYSLLSQTVKPEKLILWLAEEQFPNLILDVPQKVIDLQRSGLTIMWCEDIKSYKKLIPTLQKFPTKVIVTADDDIYYEKNWLELLLNSFLQDQEIIHCHRAHKITFDTSGKFKSYSEWQHDIKSEEASFICVPTGCGGVLYPPLSLDADVYVKNLFQELAPNADDLWFWAMAVKNNTKVKVVEGSISKLTYVNPERELGLSGEFTLSRENVGNNENDEQLKSIIKYYDNALTSFLDN